MHTDLLRVLLAEHENALLFSLSNYLTFRGCLVDSTERLAEARALVHHLQYDVVVVGAPAEGATEALALAADVAELSPDTRVILLAPPSMQVAEGAVDAAVERVVSRNLPLDELARVVCSAIVA